MAPKKSKYTWKDTTSYPRGGADAERVSAEWRLELPRSTLVLHRLHGCDQRQWFGTCHQLGISGVQLGDPSTSTDRAKAWLLELCIDKCAPLLNDLVAARGSK